MVNDGNYFVVQGWMVNKMQLSSNELMAYALIYGFTQDGESEYAGSAQYIADWLGISKRRAYDVLGRLVERGYLTKKEITVANNLKLCRYVANVIPSDETSSGAVTKRQWGGSDETSPNNTSYLNNTSNKYMKEDTNVSKKEADSDWLEFEEVWELYPKHEGKQNAMKAYLKARKEGISKETIVAGIKAYVESIKAKGTSMQYVKMGSTWFNQRCWQDDYSTAGYGKSARDYTGQYASDRDQELMQF